MALPYLESDRNVFIRLIILKYYTFVWCFFIKTILQIVDSTKSYEKALEYACLGVVDLLIMDVCRDGKQRGLCIAEQIKQQNAWIKIIMTSNMRETRLVDKAKSMHLEAMWYKEDEQIDLLELIHLVLRGECFYSKIPIVKIGLLQSNRISKRESDVLKVLACSSSNVEATKVLNISINTLNTYIRQLREKTGYENTRQILSEAIAKRVISL